MPPLLAWLLIIVCQAAGAHSPGLSSAEIIAAPEQITVKLTFALQNLEAFAPMDADLDAEVSDAERDAAKPAIAALLAREFSVKTDQRRLSPAQPGTVNFDRQNNASVEFSYPSPPYRRLDVESNLLNLLGDGHQQYVTLKNEQGLTLAEKMLHKTDLGFGFDFTPETPAAAPSKHQAFLDFFALGVEHILTGYDHLLFLFALLAVTHSFWPAIKIITFFTIAHSITLACAGLNLIELPSAFVEPFIAATIVYVGLENIVRGDHPKGRHWLTFCFGLIHGFGFASVLREMEIESGGGLLLPLLSFNLGIESGQIAVAALVLPLIWRLNQKPAISVIFLKICSLLVSLIGAYWFLQRTLGFA